MACARDKNFQIKLTITKTCKYKPNSGMMVKTLVVGGYYIFKFAHRFRLQFIDNFCGEIAQSFHVYAKNTADTGHDKFTKRFAPV